MVAEDAEVGGRERHSPWSVEPGTAFESLQQFAVWRKLRHKSQAGEIEVVVFATVLTGIGHIQIAIYLLNIERSKSSRPLVVVESVAIERDRSEACVIDLDVSGSEIGNI